MLTSRPGNLPEPIADAVLGWLREQRWWPSDRRWVEASVIELEPPVQIWLLRTDEGITCQVPLIYEPVPLIYAGDIEPIETQNVVSLANYSARHRIAGHGQPSDENEPAGLIAYVPWNDRTYAVLDATYDDRFHRELVAHMRIVEPWLRQTTNALLLPDEVADATQTANDFPQAAESPYPPDIESGRKLGAVLGVEQSNTSIIMPRVHHGVIVKVFRSVVDGEQPDLDVPNSLAAAGFAHVPRTYAVLDARVEDGRFLTGWQATLAVTSELVTDAEDGFTRISAMAAGDIPVHDDMRRLGADLNQMHQALRRAFPPEIRTVQDVLDALMQRFEDSASRSSFVRDMLGPIDTYVAALRRTVPDQPVTVQRLHGDLHLGQTLWSPHGWWILDFEGEPLRPLAARLEPDLPERDVAGMLRSIDYAAAISDGSDSWVTSARESLLAGYLEQEPPPDPRFPQLSPTARVSLIEALELDKAAYEVGYEEVHRPQWGYIPQATVTRILQPYL